MDLGPLTTFLILAEEGHMTRTAARRCLTQPAVSAQLAKLEEQVGQSLFDRTPKGMVLTEAGRILLAHVKVASAELSAGERALEQLAELEGGSLAIGGGATATTYLLPPLLAKFHHRYPAVRLFVREQGSQSVAESVAEGSLDLGVITSSSSGKPLAIEPWIEDELRLIVPRGHSLWGKRSFEWHQLEGQPFVLFEAGSAVREMIDQSVQAAGVTVEIAMELRSIESIKQMVAQGIGAAFVSRFALEERDEGLRSAATPLKRGLSLVYREDRALSVAAQTFLEMMREASAS